MTPIRPLVASFLLFTTLGAMEKGALDTHQVAQVQIKELNEKLARRGKKLEGLKFRVAALEQIVAHQKAEFSGQLKALETRVQALEGAKKHHKRHKTHEKEERRHMPKLKDLVHEDEANLLKEGFECLKNPTYHKHAKIYFEAASQGTEESEIKNEALYQLAALSQEEDQREHAQRVLRNVIAKTHDHDLQDRARHLLLDFLMQYGHPSDTAEIHGLCKELVNVDAHKEFAQAVLAQLNGKQAEIEESK